MNTSAPREQLLICSRADCRQVAAWRIEWRNPKIHDADRVKVWLACDDHRDFLHDFLATRQFPVVAVALESTDRADIG